MLSILEQLDTEKSEFFDNSISVSCVGRDVRDGENISIRLDCFLNSSICLIFSRNSEFSVDMALFLTDRLSICYLAACCWKDFREDWTDSVSFWTSESFSEYFEKFEPDS